MRAVIQPGSTTSHPPDSIGTPAVGRDSGAFAHSVAVREQLDSLTRAFVASSPAHWDAVAAILIEPFNQSPHPSRHEFDNQCARIANAIHTALLKSVENQAPRGHIEAIWRHSLGIACAGRLIAQQQGQQQHGQQQDGQLCPLQAFVAGLVHDIGKFVLAARFPKAAGRVERAVRGGEGERFEVEQGIFGVDHAAVGGHLLKLWSLPEAVQQVAQRHHLAGVANLGEPNPNLETVVEAHALLQQLAAGKASAQCSALTRALNQLEVLMTREGDSRTSVPMASKKPVDDAGPSGTQFGRDPLAVADAALNGALRQIVQLPATTSSLDELCGAACSLLIELFGLTRCVVFVESEPNRYHTCTVHGSAREFQTVIANDSVPPETCEPGLMAAAASCGHAALADRFVRTLGPGPVGCFSFGNSPRANSGLLYSLEADGSLEDDGQRLERLDAKSMQVISLALETVFESALLRRKLAMQSDEFDKKHRDHQRVEAQTLDAAAIERVARMAAGAAHEFNNPLAIIAGRAQMLQADAENAGIRSDLELIISQAQRAGDMVAQLMDYARPKRPEQVEIRLIDWANRLRQYWYRQSELRPEQLHIDISDPRVTVFADDRQLWDAATAIIENAIEAMRSSDGQLDEFAHIQINSPSTSTDDTIVVAICDNGGGMSPQVRKHALDPFFSHRAAGRGQGLGLSRAARYIEINGGRMWIESTEGEGTTVRFTLRSRPN